MQSQSDLEASLKQLTSSLTLAVRDRVHAAVGEMQSALGEELRGIADEVRSAACASIEASVDKVSGAIRHSSEDLAGNLGPRVARLEGHFQPDIFAQVLGSLSDPALVPALCEVFVDADLELATRAPPCPSADTPTSSGCSAADAAARRRAD
mmetsp:Transcript_37440/g.115454  ORF Transcript_37440/g.115454 Transcript_37440/m.115454 type:complete len:152 (+) Transcript_37440:3-458(+)